MDHAMSTPRTQRGSIARRMWADNWLNSPFSVSATRQSKGAFPVAVLDLRPEAVEKMVEAVAKQMYESDCVVCDREIRETNKRLRRDSAFYIRDSLPSWEKFCKQRGFVGDPGATKYWRRARAALAALHPATKEGKA